MTAGCVSTFSRHGAPEFCKYDRPKNRGRREMPGARCTRSPCAKGSKHTVVTTGTPDTRHSLRNGFNGLCRALLGDEFVLPPSSANWRCCKGPVGRAQHLRRFSTSNGCQDHTVLPYEATSTDPQPGHVLP